ncbi:condensation domain-containing protein, partial [Streptomyces sp. NPDC057136]|uniref:condensation domain-containing protein n=1 Tax=Streptomyces sp. NPDC057136 TaxID=3346029 RepID=UPI00363A692A
MNGELDYWRNQLADLPALELPTDRPHMPSRFTEVATVAFRVPTQTAQRLRMLADEHGTTLPVTLLAALSVLIGRYAGSDDVAVVAGIEDAALATGRSGVTVQRADLSGEPSFAELLGRMRRGDAVEGAAVDAGRGVLSEEVLGALATERTDSRSPLFQVYFGYAGPESDGYRLSGVLESEFELAVRIGDSSEGLVGEVQYSTGLFDAATVGRLAGHLVTLLEAVAADAGQRVGDLPVLSAGEREQLVEGW